MDYENATKTQVLDYTAGLEKSYHLKYIKKMSSKPKVVRMIANRTFHSAITILGYLYNIPFETLTTDIYVFCKDSNLCWMTAEFESQIELAGANPERFIFQLHSFYNNISRKIRAENLYAEIADLFGVYSELSYTHSTSINHNIVLAYADLIMQTTEYLRLNKFDLTKSLDGVTTNGDPLYRKQFVPLSDEPLLDAAEMNAANKKYNTASIFERICDIYAQSGYQIKSVQDLERMTELEKYYIATRMALFPYINEYTCDILPQIQLFSCKLSLTNIALNYSSSEIRSSLSARKRTIPANGAKLVFNDPSDEIKEMLIKEIVKNNTVIMLYRLTLDIGDIAGYYNTKSEVLYSIAQIPDESFSDIREAMQAFFLYCYALCVTDKYSVLESAIQNNNKSVSIKIYNIGGKPQNMYISDPSNNGVLRKENPNYAIKTTSVDHYIRQLPIGQKASLEAIEMARQMGYDLDENQTYVQPFCKVVFIKKDNM